MLNNKTYFIRERVGCLYTYDILDPETKLQLGIAEEKPSNLILFLRILVNKQILPTKVLIYEGTNYEDGSKLLFSIHRGFTIFRSKINIYDNHGIIVGWLKSKFFTLGGAFYVFDASDNEVAVVKGDWKGWNFQFLDKSNNKIGTITKKWAGIGKELFTTADNYIIALNQEPTVAKVILLLATGLVLDMIYKEKYLGLDLKY